MSVLTELAVGKIYERVAAEEYLAKFHPGGSLIEGPACCDIDWMIVGASGKLAAFLEIKSRRISTTSYTSTILAMRKHHAARYGKEYWKVPTVALILFVDGVATLKLHTKPDGEEMIGRRDRPSNPPVLHALYNHSGFEWHSDLFEAIMGRVREEQGL